MKFDATDVEGLFRIHPQQSSDRRGRFVKIAQRTQFEVGGLRLEPAEVYFSTSHRGVIRGMHFQKPPHHHDKVVFCLEGQVLDVVVDLRSASPTYREVREFSLDSRATDGVFVPAGCAHGFLTLTEAATLLYLVGSEYSPAADAGVRWDTLPFRWPVEEPVLSDRDSSLVSLQEFVTPF